MGRRNPNPISGKVLMEELVCEAYVLARWVGTCTDISRIAYRIRGHLFSLWATIIRSAKFFIPWHCRHSALMLFRNVLLEGYHVFRTASPHGSKCRLSPCGRVYLLSGKNFSFRPLTSFWRLRLNGWVGVLC